MEDEESIILKFYIMFERGNLNTNWQENVILAAP